MVSYTIWLTGLPCSGKSAIASQVALFLRKVGLQVEVLDGDEVRQLLWPELGWSQDERDSNVNRAITLAEMLMRNGIVVICAFVSPYEYMRKWAKERLDKVVEVYVKCPIEVCQERDKQGRYQRAERGKLTSSAGISALYEEPQNPDIIVETDKETVEESTAKIVDCLARREV